MEQQRYEHKIVKICSVQKIKELEKDGWEICGVGQPINDYYQDPTIYFKRPFQP